MVSPVHGDYRRCQAEIPLIILCRFPGPALNSSPAEVVGLDIEGFEGCFRDLDALRIAPPVDVTGDREAGFCFG